MQLALPDNEDSPTGTNQFSPVGLISQDVALKLSIPIPLVSLRCMTIDARMPMPEAAVHKYDCSILPQDNIGMTGQ